VPAEPLAVHARVAGERDDLGEEAHWEPGGVRLPKLGANLGEAGRARDQKNDPDRDEDACGDPERDLPPPRRRPACGRIGAHS
jgi:hypothetical protein